MQARSAKESIGRGAVLASTLTTLLLIACQEQKPPESKSITGEWYATNTSNSIEIEKTEYVLHLNTDFTYIMDSVQSRKVEDQDYFAKITGTEREYTGNWELSEDSKTIIFTIPESLKNERPSNFATMKLTVSDDSEMLTRSDENARASLLVFSREKQ